MDLSAQGTDPEETVVVKEHKRTRKKKSVRDDLYALLPIRDIKCDVPESERFCPDCDAPMEHLGYKTVREELRITPAKVERVRYLQETLVCPVCREGDDTTIRAIVLHHRIWWQWSCTRKAVCTFPSTARKKTGLRKESLFQGIPEHTGTTTVLWNTLPLYMKHFTRSF